ncbi:hypothetical protein HZF24_13705 [Sedimentibacter hydroxybenzoicus DSM 7310]|uniref:Uncharacterized protein n=1 Tax=Sedimentibacter hydroxybenzoicus DSM 7310 TaxID=1123245 RepID=A0A974BL44_SEDHY|nr:hypothetical protein [Sedimentibacter hydroxybenzoicus]NYB75199.1 hypothetical protein [Sedimentibacter hydroxybenzoicus DSM 7310]
MKLLLHLQYKRPTPNRSIWGVCLKHRKILILFLIILILPSCSINNLEKAKNNNEFASEYNDVIKDYNRLAAKFTEIARFIDKNTKGNTYEFDTKAWKDYDKKKSDVVLSIDKLNNFEFKYQENMLCMEEINPLISNIEEYLNVIDKFRSGSYYFDYNEFNDKLEKLYNNILKQSNIVSDTFNNIYNQYIIQ